MSRLHYLHPQALQPLHQNLTTDICIYGGNASGVIAALQTARMGKSAILLEPSLHLGGLSAGGLSWTDFGKKDSVGGLAREFYQRAGKAYNNPPAPGSTIPAEEWCFEPHIAERIFDDMLTEAQNLTNVQLFKTQLLKSVAMQGKKITSITMQSGLTIHAKVFLDCSYEGDLMANAGVSFHVGRESNNTYAETLNGAQVMHSHQFNLPVSPFLIENDPASGLLPGIEPQPPIPGAADHRIQAYNFRLCLTQGGGKKSNLIPFEKPANYSPAPYELLARYFAAGATLQDITPKFDPLCGHKVDKNNHGAVSTDFIGANYAYPNADHKTREQIFQAHVAWTKGLLFFLGHDPRVPALVREWWNSWGLCKDEFTDCHGFSHALYIREARRMIADYIMLEQDCKSQRTAPDPVGMGSYGIDSHNCQRFSDGNQVRNEGDVQVGLKAPYAISFRSIVPRLGECENLLVPVCCSSSHIAYGSIRMEPVFMVLGQSAATAAACAIEGKTPVQKVPYGDLKKLLLDQKQVLSL